MPRRARRLPRRELTVEVSLTAIFLAAAVALIAVGSAPFWAAPMALAMVGAYAIASRVAYPIATGVAVPTQPFLVGMFAFADVRLVPLLALAGLTLGTIAACSTGRARWDRLSFAGGDLMHVLGPAIFLSRSATRTPGGAMAGDRGGLRRSVRGRVRHLDGADWIISWSGHRSRSSSCCRSGRWTRL